jgi:hypothetical protein
MRVAKLRISNRSGASTFSLGATSHWLEADAGRFGSGAGAKGGSEMLKKLTTGFVVVAGTLAMALPAHASAVPGAARTAKFHKSHGAAGSVTMSNVNGQWKGSAQFTGLAPGSYDVFVTQQVTGGSATGLLCSFKVRARQTKPATCNGTSDSALMGNDWLKGSNNLAELDLLGDNTGTPVFAHDAIFRR